MSVGMTLKVPHLPKKGGIKILQKWSAIIPVPTFRLFNFLIIVHGLLVHLSPRRMA